MITNSIILSLTMMSFLSLTTTRDLPTVESVDIDKYAGLWYEIARLPNRFEKGLECVSARYTVKENGKIEVLNKGYITENKGEFKQIKGTAWVPDANYPGRLKVRFFWPFSGNYYIISLAEDYSHALVGDPSRKYLWVLSRDKTMDPTLQKELLEMARTYGFETDKVIRINQECN